MLKKIIEMVKSMFDKGLVVPIPNPLIPGLGLRLFRLDLDPEDRRVGITLQLEWE